MKTYFTRDARKIFFLVKHLKFLPFKYQNFVHVPQKYSDVQPHTTYPKTLLFCSRRNKGKQSLFNVERVPKGIFWGETYFLDFYRVTHSIKIFPCSAHFSLMQHRLFLKLMAQSLIKNGYQDRHIGIFYKVKLKINYIFTR